MAIINTYPTATPKGADLLIGTQENSTKSFTVDALGSYIVTSTSGITGSGTLNTIAMFTPNGQAIGDSILTQDVGATQLTVNGQLRVSDSIYCALDLTVDNTITVNGSGISTFNGNVVVDGEYLEIQCAIKDALGNLPSSTGQILVGDASGDVTWTDPTDIATGAAEVVEVPVKNLQGSALTKGDPVYISGSVGASGRLEVQLADASNAAKMPALGLLKQDLGINEEGFVVVTGKLRNLPTDPIDGQTPLANDVVYVKAGGTTGAALTLTKPTGSNLIQNMGKVGRVSTSNDGTLVVSSILRTNDVPNLTDGKIWVGSTGNTIESQAVFIDEANNRLGVNTATPVTNLHVQGGIRITGEVDLFQGNDNTFVGTSAGNQGTITGGFNTAFGKNSLSLATTASRNTSIGFESLLNSNANNNVAIGYQASINNVAGSFNVSIGNEANANASVQNSSVAIGYHAQKNGNPGNNNIAIGREALRDNGAALNTAIGRGSLILNTTGAENTAVGYLSLDSNTTGRWNTAVGSNAGSNITNGENNIVIGRNATASSATVDNEITLGNSSTSVLRCAVTTITSLSDERDKKDIKPLDYGLDFINSLSPKQFTWNPRDEYVYSKDDEGNEIQELVVNANKDKKDFGFIAQEVQSVDNDILRLVYAENPEKLEMSYGKLVPILVQAIKELTNRIEALEQ